LLLRSGRVVPVADLLEAAWDDAPPATAERQVRNRVAALRVILTRHGGLIDTVDSGYRLRLDGASLDLAVFDDLVSRGRAGIDPAMLRQALGLWRGPALDGLGGTVLVRAAAALEESRLAVVEDCLTWEADRSPAALSDLRELVAAHPLRERLVGLLMAALAGNGRREEALTVYESLATRLADEIGIDPSAELRRQYQGLRRSAVPAQLPADVVGFVGRADDLARLDGLLSDAQAGRTAVLSAIDGTVGVGKTALAVHWGHSVRDKFPDGQLYVNLRGYSSGAPADPVDVLGGFLRALGVPGARVPAEMTAASALYRDRLADRQVLVVLDNAADADQVRPLLPDTPGCLALVTSRHALPTLVEAVPVTLDVLAPTDAYALLVEVLGSDRVGAEPGAARELARLCAYLPLALRIAAANLGDSESIADYAARLAASDDRLTALSIEGDERAAVRAAFDLSFAGLPTAAQRMFRLLGVLPGPDVTVPAAASMAAVDEHQARVLLDRLVAAHLLDEHTPGRYTSHDLLRAYAVELAQTQPDRVDALHRLLDHYVSATIAANDIVANRPVVRWVPPPTPLPGVVCVDIAERASALAWFADELPAIAAAIPRAASVDLHLHVWWLAVTQFHIAHLWGLFPALAASMRAAVEAAGHLDGWRPAAIAHNRLADAYQYLGDIAAAEQHARIVVELAKRYADHVLATRAYRALAVLCAERSDHASAVAYAREAYRLAVLAGRPLADALNTIGYSQAHLGEYDEALASCQAALAEFQRLDDLSGEAHTHDSIAFVHHRRGDNETAARHYREAISIHRRRDDRYHRAQTLVRLGDLLAEAGDPAGAHDAWHEALDVFDQIDHPDADTVRAKLDS
jgi:DNA-binding SARP family transcriptional activator/Tfp pilus assembly protein PilF